VFDIMAPSVRVRTALRWRYEVRDQAQDELLSTGEIPLHLFPTGILASVRDRLVNTVEVVAEEDSSLVEALTQAGIDHRRHASVRSLPLRAMPYVLVETSPLSVADQHHLRQIARAGSGVVILEQQTPGPLMGFTLRRCAAPEHLQWRDVHALWRGLAPADLASWLEGEHEVVALVQPVDVPGLALATWPQETQVDIPVPRQTLVLSQSQERGRLLFCQLPLRDWDRDPRSQIFLVNVFDYLGSPPGLTASPEQEAAMAGARSDVSK